MEKLVALSPPRGTSDIGVTSIEQMEWPNGGSNENVVSSEPGFVDPWVAKNVAACNAPDGTPAEVAIAPITVLHSLSFVHSTNLSITLRCCITGLR